MLFRSPSSNLIIKAHTAVYNKEKREGLSISYPLIDASKGLIDAVIDLPSTIISLLDDSTDLVSISKRQSLLASGNTRNDIFSRESSIYDGTHPRYGIERDGRWFVDGDSMFGTIIGNRPFFELHPYYNYLVK